MNKDKLLELFYAWHYVSSSNGKFNTERPIHSELMLVIVDLGEAVKANHENNVGNPELIGWASVDYSVNDRFTITPNCLRKSLPRTSDIYKHYKTIYNNSIKHSLGDEIAKAILRLGEICIQYNMGVNEITLAHSIPEKYNLQSDFPSFVLNVCQDITSAAYSLSIKGYNAFIRKVDEAITMLVKYCQDYSIDIEKFMEINLMNRQTSISIRN